MNVVFISPHFPLYFHNFCSRLKERGVNVLGIGDEDYNLISEETKQSVSVHIGGARGTWETFKPSSQFGCKPKTAHKKTVL